MLDSDHPIVLHENGRILAVNQAVTDILGDFSRCLGVVVGGRVVR